MDHEIIASKTGGLPIKAWTRGLPIEAAALQQLRNVASLPIVRGWVAAMPDVHWGIGATVGSVIPTAGAVIPAAVGVDIGCGMMAVRTSLAAQDLPDDLPGIRRAIEARVPLGAEDFSSGRHDQVNRKHGARAEKVWRRLRPGYEALIARRPELSRRPPAGQLGTLGGGNHFIEVCLDEEEQVWLMLHSGSRNIGNRIGQLYIELARRDMRQHIADLPDRDLAYLPEGSPNFEAYVQAVEWAQSYARANRELMMASVIDAMASVRGLKTFEADRMVVNCHHNYVSRETHLGEPLFVTRKGAVSARAGELGIIPGSMGARSFIVRGKGNPESFHSCSHGAGRLMSRSKAKKVFSVDDHVEATRGVECRKDAGVIDETPGAYKPIDQVMAAQADLVEVVHRLKQIVCVKG